MSWDISSRVELFRAVQSLSSLLNYFALKPGDKK